MIISGPRKGGRKGRMKLRRIPDDDLLRLR